MKSATIDAGIIPSLSMGFFPHDSRRSMRDNSTMANSADFLDRLDTKLAEKGMTDRQASIKITGKPDLIRDLRRHGSLPRGTNLVKLAELLDISVEWLMSGEGNAYVDPPSNAVVSEAPLGFRHQGGPKDLPVLGTAHGGEMDFNDEGGVHHIERTIFEPTEVIRRVARPPALIGQNEAYAIYFQGDSMYPRFAQGEMGVVDPRRPPMIGDDVIVQLLGEGHEAAEITTVLVKRLVRRSASYIELEQFNPATAFRIPAKRVARIHRIVPMGDLLG